MDWPLLSTIVFLPLLGAGFLLLVRGRGEAAAQNARDVALWTSLVTLGLTLLLWAQFDARDPGFQFVERYPWLGDGIGYALGVDGISVMLIVLTALLTPICVLASGSIAKRVPEYMFVFLVMETLVLGAFAALDLILFYLFFEGGLIPMFLIIGIWGGAERIYASFKFFLYTLLGSVLMLVAILVMYQTAGTTYIPDLLAYEFSGTMQFWLWLAFFASFAVKLPMWPLHTWLPDAHVQAPTAGSVLLAGILLKLGGYGFLRFSVPMFPLASDFFAPLIFALSLIAIIYTSLVALAQENMKKLVAYSSVAHMGFVTLGIFSMTPYGLQGALLQMLSHGVISAALFLAVGVVYERTHRLEISAYGGVSERMPIYAAVLLLFLLGTAGLPGTSAFVAEFLVILGAFQRQPELAAVAALGIILSAAYALWLYRRICLGKLEKDALRDLPDLRGREMLAFAPLVLAVLLFGIWPKPLLRTSEASMTALQQTYEARLSAAPQGSAALFTRALSP